MTRYFTFITGILLSASCGFMGCKKDKDMPGAASVITGSASGTASPAGSVKSIVAISTATAGNKEAKIDSTNGFSIADLVPGDYKIAFTATPGFVAPDTVLVTIAAGKNADMGTVVFTKVATPVVSGSISGKVSPADAGVVISVTNSNGFVQYGGHSDSAGNFRIDGISPGLYQVSFAPSLLFATPGNVPATVTAGNTTDVGTISVSQAGFKNIDTISTLLSFYTPADANDFVARAAKDSAIVLTASIYVYYVAITPELMEALNKIIVAKSYFQIFTDSNTLSLTGLREVAQLNVIASGNLTLLNLPSLTRAWLKLSECPLLTNINVSALNYLTGLEIYNTGLTSLAAFQSAVSTPYELSVSSNKNLTSLAGIQFTSGNMGKCTIYGNPMLTSLEGLQGIKTFSNELSITYNPALQSLTGLENAVSAHQLTLSNNPQLNTICPAKTLLTYMKTAPTFTRSGYDIDGHKYTETVQPFTASANGSYETLASLEAAINQCP